MKIKTNKELFGKIKYGIKTNKLAMVAMFLCISYIVGMVVYSSFDLSLKWMYIGFIIYSIPWFLVILATLVYLVYLIGLVISKFFIVVKNEADEDDEKP